MDMEVVSVGKLAATHGVKGAMILVHSLGRKTNLTGVEALFLEDKTGSRIPFFLTAAKARSESETVVELEGIQTREAAVALLQKRVSLSLQDFEQHAADNAPLALVGYQVVDQGKLLGPVQTVTEMPHQLLCSVFINGKEVLIPLHEASLVRIDRKKKEVHVALPEGLVDLYLEG